MQVSDSTVAENRDNYLKESGEDVSFKERLPDAVKRGSPLRSSRWKVGYVIAFMKCVLVVFNVNIAVTLPFMVGSRGALLHTVRAFNNETVQNQNLSISANEEQYYKVAEFTWGTTLQCFVLSSYFFGYLATQIPASWAVSRFGGKHVVTAAVGASTVLSLVTPVTARASVHAFIIIRVLLGACAGLTVPATCQLVSTWSLPHERSKFITMVWLGQSVGIVVAYVTSGVLCASGFDGGWSFVFYIHAQSWSTLASGGFSLFNFSVLGAVLLVPWVLFIADSPDNHARISGAERHLLSVNQHNLQLSTGKNQIPWQRVLCSGPVWAVFVTHMLDSFTFWLVLLYMPLYLSQIISVHVVITGLLSALPFLCSGIGFAAAAYLADALISRKGMPITTTRKIFGIVGLCCGGIFVMVPGYLACDQLALVTLCFCCSLLFLGVSQGAGYTRNAAAMAPRYGGVIMAISSTLASLPVALTTLIAAEVFSFGTDLLEWRVLLDTAAVCALLAALVYGIFSSCDLEWWARSLPGEPCEKEDDTYLLCYGLFHPDEQWP